jgi:hypothetical protein
MDPMSLEEAIRHEAAQQIRSLCQRESDEIRKLDDAYAAELGAFKDRVQAQTDARIGLESSKAENRSFLDLKKFKLKSLETFITRTVGESLARIRDSPKYKKFLLEAIAGALGVIPAGAEIRLRGEDLALEKELREALKTVNGSKDMVFREDSSIRWGGCIVIDVPGGRILDGTIERVYFRKSLAIRREVMRILADS